MSRLLAVILILVLTMALLPLNGCRSAGKSEEFYIKGQGRTLVALIHDFRIKHDGRWPTSLLDLHLGSLQNDDNSLNLERWNYTSPTGTDEVNTPVLQTSLENGCLVFFYFDGRIEIDCK
jgi:hypothetical protein